MNRRDFIKLLTAIPFLGFLKPEIPVSQPLARLDLIAEGMEVSGNELLEATKPVVEEMAKQTIYFTPYHKVESWNGKQWNAFETGTEGELYIQYDFLLETPE